MLFTALVFHAVTFAAILEPKSNLPRIEPRFITASSFLKNGWNSADENYLPPYVADDDPKTAWVEGADDDGVGQHLTWLGPALKKVRRYQLFIRNGYQKSQKLFDANGVPSEIKLQPVRKDGDTVLPAGKAITVKLTRALGWQEVWLPTEANVQGFVLTLTAIDSGRVYKDTCISDLRVYVDGDDAYNEAAEAAVRQQTRDFVMERRLAGKKAAGKRNIAIAPSYALEKKTMFKAKSLDTIGDDPALDKALRARITSAWLNNPVVSLANPVQVVNKQRLRASARIALSELGSNTDFPGLVSFFHKDNFAVFQIKATGTKKTDNLANEKGEHEGPDDSTNETETFSGFIAYPKVSAFQALCTAAGTNSFYSSEGRESSSSGSEREERIECIHYTGDIADAVVQTRARAKEEKSSNVEYHEGGHSTLSPEETKKEESASAIVYLLDWKKATSGAQMLASVTVVDPQVGTVERYLARE